jgi:uncharacterized membrane protein YqaE (UPF0057 family)
MYKTNKQNNVKKAKNVIEKFDSNEDTANAFALGYDYSAYGVKWAYDYVDNSDFLGGNSDFDGTDAAEYDIYTDNYNLVDRVLYGGMMSGAIVIPTNFFKIIFSIIFPPIGTLLDIIEDEILASFPWITWNTIKKIFDYENLNKIIYTFILTSMFYIPGLIYALANLTTNGPTVKGVIRCNPDTGKCIDISSLEDKE